MSLVELELPVPARERVAGVELAHVRLDLLAARHPHDQLGVGAARAARRTSAPGNAPPKRVFTSVMPRPISGSRNAWTVQGPRTLQRLGHRAAELDQLLVLDHGALDRLAAARLDHRARDRVQAAAVEVAEDVDRELRPAHQALHHHGLLDVADEELHLLAVGGRVDRARAGALARLDHHRVRLGLLARQHRGRATAGRGAAAARAWRTCRRCRGTRRARGTNAGSPSPRASTSMSRSVSGTTALTS